MELNEAIKNRRSIRKFSNQSIDNSLIEKIIEAGHWAPSHCNTQAWRFIVVKNEQIKKEMVAAGGAPTIKYAPMGILVLYEDVSENLEYQDYIQSAAAAIQNMLLTAHSLGLGGCWICHLPPKKTLRKIFSIPKNFNPIAYVLLGYPVQPPAPAPRKLKTLELISYNQFNFNFKKTAQAKIKIKRFFKKIYYFLPNSVKKLIFPLINKFLIKKFTN